MASVAVATVAPAMWSYRLAVAAVNTVEDAVAATTSCSGDVFPTSTVVPGANPVVDPTVNARVPAVADVVTVVFVVVASAPEQA